MQLKPPLPVISCLMCCIGPIVQGGNRSPSAEAIVDKAMEAMGGRAKLAKLDNGTWKGIVTVLDEGKEYRVSHTGYWQGLDRLRFELEWQMDGETQKLVMGVKDNRYWIKDSGSDFPDLRLLMECWYALRLPCLMPFKDSSLSVIPEIEIDDRPAEGIRVARDGHQDVELYFDKTSHLPVKTETWTSQHDGKKVHFECIFSGYKKFHGIMQPAKIKFKLADKDHHVLLCSLELSEIQPLDSLDPRIFGRRNPAGKASASELDDKAQELLRSEFAWDMAQGYRALFEAAGTEGVRKLKLHSHDGIALQAAWEEVVFSIPEKDAESNVRWPDRQQVNRFLGFLEGRARLQVPAWWAALLVEVEAGHGDGIWFPMSKMKRHYHQAGFGYTYAPDDTTVKQEKGKIVLKVGQQSVTLPDSLIKEERLGGSICVSALITSEKCFVALHGIEGFWFPLFCVERTSGKILWRTQVWADFWGMASGLGGNQGVTVTKQGNRIVVFGLSDFGAYVEAFDSKDGKNLFRFCTSYSD